MRKPVFGVSDLVRHKPGCVVTEDGLRLEISDLGSSRDCSICVAKTKALISGAVTAQLICVFVFAYAKSRFSDIEASFIGITRLCNMLRILNGCKSDDFQMIFVSSHYCSKQRLRRF